MACSRWFSLVFVIRTDLSDWQYIDSHCGNFIRRVQKWSEYAFYISRCAISDTVVYTVSKMAHVLLHLVKTEYHATDPHLEPLQLRKDFALVPYISHISWRVARRIIIFSHPFFSYKETRILASEDIALQLVIVRNLSKLWSK